MTDEEFFSPPSLDTIEMMDMTGISNTTKGMLLDGVWKVLIREERGSAVSIPQQGAALDAHRLETDGAADVKLCQTRRQSEYGDSANVYISHNEYMFGKARNTIYVIYWLIGRGTARRVATFSFNEAKEAGAIQLFTNGKYVKSNLTGKMEPPWAINILQVSAAYAERLVLE